MIRFRSGKASYCRYISLVVCAVMVLGIFMSFSPQPARADDMGNLATYLQNLYNQVEANPNHAADMTTLKTIYNNAVSLPVYDPSNSGALPWSTVFASGNLDLTKLAASGYGGDMNWATIAVSTLLKDYAEMVYYGSQGTYSSSVIDNFWNMTYTYNSNTYTNGQTLGKIAGSTVDEETFSAYMLASMEAIPAAVKSLLATLSAVEQGQVLNNIADGDLADPVTNNFLQDCIASALDGTATSYYPQFSANPTAADWSFGSDLINKGYRFVDNYISTGVNDTVSAGEVILMKYMPLPTTPTTPPHGSPANNVPVYYPPVPPPAPPVTGENNMVARWPGNVPLMNQGAWYSTSGSVYADFTQAAPDQATLTAAEAKGLQERAYYFNEQYQRWVALASYPQADGSVLVKDDGGYSNVWITLYAVQQPTFTDISGYWAEDVINRMNGLALIEGYPIPGDPNQLDRTAGPDRNITRAEFVTIVTRALGCLPPDEQKLYGVLPPLSQESDQILSGITGIPDWSRDFVADAVYGGLVVGRPDGDFGGNDPITRIEAAIIISNMLKRLPNYQPADLAQFADAADVPDWAKEGVANGVLTGYPDGTLQPNEPITRAEAMVTILKMLRALGW